MPDQYQPQIPGHIKPPGLFLPCSLQCAPEPGKAKVFFQVCSVYSMNLCRYRVVLHAALAADAFYGTKESPLQGIEITPYMHDICKALRRIFWMFMTSLETFSSSLGDIEILPSCSCPDISILLSLTAQPPSSSPAPLSFEYRRLIPLTRSLGARATGHRA